MLSALYKLPFALLLIAAAAYCQGPPPQIVNPHTQIRWPGLCVTPGMVYTFQDNTCVDVMHIDPSRVTWPTSCATGTYVPATNTCVATGTAANPGGGAPQMQFNAGGTFGGDSVVVMDTTGSTTTPVHTLMGNLNGDINPYNYGARGDNGATDDTAAITAACNAAKSYSPPAKVAFPKASGYYLTGPLDACAGVSLTGKPANFGSATAGGGVQLRGKPGMDVLHWHDPNTATGTAPARSWEISDMNIVVDNSVDASSTGTNAYPHRWPGRWTQDGSNAATITQIGIASNVLTVMASNAFTIGQTVTLSGVTTNTFLNAQAVVVTFASATQFTAAFTHANVTLAADTGTAALPLTILTSNRQLWQCSDIGSAIKVVGAGAAGADLITTIASMPACGTAQNTITLAAAASVPVINALVYTSVPGVSATQTMGNCAIGADNSDGDTTHWASGWTGGMIPSYPSIRNVNINSTSGNAANNTCGIFFQGIWQPYGIHAETVNVQRLQYGVVQACPDIAPQSGICGEDQQWWIHVLVNATYPWISYGGGYNHLAGWQLSSNSTGAGPFILEVGISNGSAVTWDIHVPEWELASIGWIVRGTGHNLHGSQIVAAGTRSYFDTSSATCDPCYARATYPTGSGLTINGYGNTFSFKNSTAGLLGLRSSGRADIDGLLGTGVLQDNGVNNTITVNQLDSPGLGGQPGQTTAVNISRDLGFALSRSAEFAVGNAATPYYNRQDLLFFPKDYMFNPAQPIVADSNSYSGFYVARTVNDATRGFTTFKADPLQAVGNGQARICNIPAGCQVPASVVTVYESAKCPVQTSYTFNVQANLGSTVASATFPCTTTYTTNSIVVDLSTQNGKNLGFSWSGVTNEVDDAWIAVVPYSVSSTGAPNTVPKTKPGSSTLDPSWIPGVGNAMQRVAQVAPTLDTTGANINNIILYTTPAAGNYMLCGYLDMVVAASAGTYSMSGNYVSDGHTFAVIITASVGPAQWSVSSGVSPTTGSPCQNFYADAGTNITAKITATGITGSPTLRYVASLWQL